MLPKMFLLSGPAVLSKSLCANRHAASTQSCHDHHPQIRKGTQFYPFQVSQGTASISKNRKIQKISQDQFHGYFRLHFPYPCSRLPAQKNTSSSGSVRQLPVSAPAFHTFSPASLARIPHRNLLRSNRELSDTDTCCIINRIGNSRTRCIDHKLTNGFLHQKGLSSRSCSQTRSAPSEYPYGWGSYTA